VVSMLHGWVCEVSNERDIICSHVERTTLLSATALRFLRFHRMYLSNAYQHK
jgi:hypothetical protein